MIGAARGPVIVQSSEAKPATRIDDPTKAPMSASGMLSAITWTSDDPTVGTEARTAIQPLSDPRTVNGSMAKPAVSMRIRAGRWARCHASLAV
jgi:hypothetical protein